MGYGARGWGKRIETWIRENGPSEGVKSGFKMAPGLEMLRKKAINERIANRNFCSG